MSLPVKAEDLTLMEALEDAILDQEAAPEDLEETIQVSLDNFISKADLEEKVERLGYICKLLKADSGALADEIKSLRRRKEVKDNKMERIKEYLQYLMHTAGLKKVDRPKALVRTKKNPASVDILDLDAVPDEYIDVVRKPMRSVIGDDLKAGKEVPGTRLVTDKESLTIK